MFGYNAQATIDEYGNKIELWKDGCSDAYELILELQRLIPDGKLPHELDMRCEKFFKLYDDNCM